MPRDRLNSDVHNDTLDKIFTRLFVDGSAESQVAIGRLKNELERIGVSPSDVKLVYGNDLLNRLYERSKEYEARAERAERENYVLRQHASKDALRALRVERSGGADGWIQLLDVLKSKISLKRGWKAKIIKALGISKSMFRDYENGIQSVPHALIDKAASLPVFPSSATARPGRPEPPIAQGTLVLDTGPMTFDELRLIGTSFNDHDWMHGICQVANARPKTVSEWKRRGIPENQAKVIRYRYQKAQAAGTISELHVRSPDNIGSPSSQISLPS